MRLNATKLYLWLFTYIKSMLNSVFKGIETTSGLNEWKHGSEGIETDIGSGVMETTSGLMEMTWV